MAKDKNSFLLYCDLLHTVEKMPDEKAGQLMKHILRYVNDQNPKTDDLIIQLTFEPIKQRLKRDLKEWESKRNKRSEAGKKGMEHRWKNHNIDNKDITKDNNVIHDITNITDTVTVTVPVSVKERKKRNNSIFLKPDLNDVVKYFSINGYTEKSAKKFFDYYDVSDWHDSKGNKIVNWKQKAQSVWFKDENKNIEINKPKLAM